MDLPKCNLLFINNFAGLQFVTPKILDKIILNNKISNSYFYKYNVEKYISVYII